MRATPNRGASSLFAARASNEPASALFISAMALVVVGACVVDGWSAFHYGFDFLDLILGGHRFLVGDALYAQSGPMHGFVGPPFEAMFLAPFAALAAIDLTTARIAWLVLLVLTLFGGVWMWSAALSRVRWTDDAVAWADWRRSPAVLLALAAVAFPIYREMQSQNIDAAIFFLMALTAISLVDRRDVLAGVSIGFATALKLIPGLVIVYFIARRMWKAAVIAAAATALFSLAPIARYGVRGFIDQCRDWMRTRVHGDWPVSWHNQSISNFAQHLAPGHTGVVIGAATTAVLLLLVIAKAWGTDDARWKTAVELPLVITVAVLVSPFAWINYWMWTFPAFVILAGRTDASRVMNRKAFVAAAICTLIIPLVQHNAPMGEDTIAGLILVAVLALPKAS